MCRIITYKHWMLVNLLTLLQEKIPHLWQPEKAEGFLGILCRSFPLIRPVEISQEICLSAWLHPDSAHRCNYFELELKSWRAVRKSDQNNNQSMERTNSLFPGGLPISLQPRWWTWVIAAPDSLYSNWWAYSEAENSLRRNCLHVSDKSMSLFVHSGQALQHGNKIEKYFKKGKTE